MKIFRSKFLVVEISILKGGTYQFIRRGYFGGGTDYYKAYGQNVFHYDVNLLYPFVMCNPMPHTIIKYHENLNIELIEDNQLFGFFSPTPIGVGRN